MHIQLPRPSKAVLKQSSVLTRFARDERGVTYIMFTAALFGVMVSVGGAVDISRKALAREELSSAVDAAALAACRAFRIDQPEATMEAIQTEEATNYMKANFDQGRYEAPNPTISVTFPETTATTSTGTAAQRIQSVVKTRVSATVAIPTRMMKMIGVPSLTVNSVSECTRSQGGIELTLVLDTTGSMDSPIGGVKKIDSLRRATTNMINLLFNNQEQSDFIRVNILPYSQSVNVGKLLATNDIEANPGDPSYNRSNPNWLGCILERPTVGTIGFSNSGARTVDYSDAAAVAPPLAWDLRDIPAGANDTVTGMTAPKWQPYLQELNKGSVTRQEVGYFANNNRYELTSVFNNPGTIPTKYNSNSRGGCPGEAVMWNGTQSRTALTNNSTQTRTQLVNKVNDSTWLKPGGYTYSDVGMMWGVRMMSNGAPFESAVLPEDRFSTDTANVYQGWVKAIVLMTDGVIDAGVPLARGWSRTDGNQNDESNYSVYGFRQRGTGVYGTPRTLPSTLSSDSAYSSLYNTVYADLTNAHEHRLLIACKLARRPAGWSREEDAMRVYTVFFGTAQEASGKGPLYKACAGRDGRFVNATNESELNETFSNIASDLQNLRLSL